MKLHEEQYEKIKGCFPKQRKPAKISSIDKRITQIYTKARWTGHGQAPCPTCKFIFADGG